MEADPVWPSAEVVAVRLARLPQRLQDLVADIVPAALAICPAKRDLFSVEGFCGLKSITRRILELHMPCLCWDVNMGADCSILDEA
eukprot:6562269-Alexandrium_andersonii.AAC.1